MKKRNRIGIRCLAAILVFLAVFAPSGFAADTPVAASENGGFIGLNNTQDVTQNVTTRDAYGYNNDDYAYLRFAIDAANDTIGGVAAADISSVSLNVTVVDATLNSDELSFWALDDLANPGAGFLTETTWNDSNLLNTNAPHGNVEAKNAAALTTSLGSLSKGNIGDVSTSLDVSLALDLAAFKTLITASSNDEITLIVAGPKNRQLTFASIDNTSGYGVPTLMISTSAQPPAAPTGLTGAPGDQSVSLDWDDHSDSNATYSVYRSETSDTYGTALVTGLTTNNYLDSPLSNGTTYYYEVTATGTNTLESDPSNEISVTPWDPNETNAPATPSGLAATAGDGQVNLDWADNTELDLASYSVYRSTNSGSYGAALASNLTESAYADYTPSNGVTYYYAVSAVDNNGNESDLSGEQSASPVALYFAKYTFSDLTLSSSDTRTDSTASDLLVGSGLSTNFEQRTSGSRGNPIPSLTWKIGDCTDETLLDDDYLSFTVTADSGSLTFGSLSFDYDGAKEDVYLFSSQNGFETLTDAIAAVKSTGFANHVISLAGMDDAAESSTTEFRLYFKSTSTYTGGDLWIDNLYLDVTPAAAGPDLIPPVAPTGLEAIVGDGQVTLNWNDNAEDDVAIYTVYRSTNSGSYGSPQARDLVSSDYVDTKNLVDETTYYYTVTATDTSDNESAKSAEVSANLGDYTPPPTPTGLVARAGNGFVRLDWDEPEETFTGSYSVYRSTNSGSYGSALVSDVISSEYIDNTTFNSTTYYYTVTAMDAAENESAKSAEVSAIPLAVGPSRYEAWVSVWSNDVIGAATNDYDSDGLINLHEYGFDGNPTDDQDQGTKPTFTKVGDSFLYVYPKRSDDPTLTYTVETTTHLTEAASWSGSGHTETGTDVTGGTLDFVTNEVDLVGPEKFVRLLIEQ